MHLCHDQFTIVNLYYVVESIMDNELTIESSQQEIEKH